MHGRPIAEAISVRTPSRVRKSYREFLELTMRRCLVPVASLAVLGISSAGFVPQRQVDVTSDQVASDVRVEIDNLAGSVRITGWDDNRVRVRGTLAPEAEGLLFEVDRGDVEIGVDMPRRRRRDPEAEIGEAHLEINVPRNASVEVEALASSITAEGVDGDVRFENTAGNITYAGAARRIEADSASGDIEVDSSTDGALIDVEGVAGSIVVQVQEADVRAGTVTGDVRVIGGVVREGDFESVSGTLYFEGELAPRGDLSFENFNGNIELLVPDDSSAAFDITTFSGAIETEFGFEGRSVDPYTPEQQAEFVLGSGGASVDIETFAGTVSVRRR